MSMKRAGYWWSVTMFGLAGCSSDRPIESPHPALVEEKHAEVATARPAPTPSQSEPSLKGKDGQEEESDPALADGPAKSIGKEEARILVKSLPLRLDAVRFEAIEKFLLLYAPFTSNKALLRATKQRLRETRAHLAEDASAFNLSTDMKGLISMAKDPKPQHYLAFVASADALVSRTMSVIADFYEKVRDAVGEDDRNLILGQIGATPNDTSIASRNSRALERLRQQLTKNMRTCDGDGKNCRPTFPE